MSYADIKSAGLPTRGLTYKRLQEHLRMAQEDAAMLSHLHNTEDSQKDIEAASGWLLISELLKKMQHQVMMLEVGRMQ